MNADYGNCMNAMSFLTSYFKEFHYKNAVDYFKIITSL
jgi:hypothetical protein